MFKLEEAIAQWRRQMLAAGIAFPVPLEELESHLRDDVDRQVRSGLGEAEAFAAAVARMGQAPALRDEFIKTAKSGPISRIASLGNPVSVAFASVLPPGVATLRKFAPLPYLAAVLCFYLPFFEVSFAQRFSTAPTGQNVVYGEYQMYDAPDGSFFRYPQTTPNILAIAALSLAIVALLLSLIRRPATRQISGWVGLSGAAALWFLKDSFELGTPFQILTVLDLQMRAGFWLALLGLVPGAALQFKLVKWERLALGAAGGKAWPSRPKSWRRNLMWGFAGCGTGLLAVFLWLFVSPDEMPPDVSDLVVAPLKLPDDQNAYAIIMQATELVKTDLLRTDSAQVDEMSKGKNWNAALAPTLLDGSDAIWPLWEQAARTPQGQAAPAAIPQLISIFNVSKLALIRAWDLAHMGNPDAAIESLFTTLQVGQRLEQSRGDTFYYSTGKGLKVEVLNSLRGLTTEFKPSATLIRQTLRQVEASRPDKDALAHVLRGEFRSFSDELDDLESHDYVSPEDQDQKTRRLFKIITHIPFLFHPNQTRRIFAEATRKVIGEIDQKPGDPGDLRTADNLRKLVGDHYNNLLGLKFLLPSIGVGEIFQLDQRLGEQSSVSANEAFLALVLYQREYGELPATLDALVPDYLPAVPRDYFDGQPIRYSRDFRAVWSVGLHHFTVTAADMGHGLESDVIYLPLDFAAPAATPQPTPASPPPP